MMMTANPVVATKMNRPLPASWLVRPPVREVEREEWLCAVAFVERVQAHRERGSLPGLFAGALARGARPEQRWLAQAPFSSPSVFARRLALDGVSEQEFRAILGGAAVPAGGRGDQVAPWLARWVALYGRDPVAGAAANGDAEPMMSGLVDILEPVLTDARGRLKAGIKQLATRYDDCPFDVTAAEAMWYAALPVRLAQIGGQTMNLELGIADLRGDLMGAKPADRLRSFFRGYCQREAALALFREYPLLARQLSECIESWIAAGLEFLRHLCEDWAEIAARFNAGVEPGKLVDLDGDAGERHRGGRCVVIARFTSGLRLVYQPSSTALDGHFQQLLEWINQRGAGIDYRTLRVLDCGDHGWLEHVVAEPCASTEELRRFHRRQGGYLALTHALDATDFQCDDLVAVGEQPMLLDPAALFCPRLALFANDVNGVATVNGDTQHLPNEAELASRVKLPRLADAADTLREYVGDIDAGFSDMYRLLTEHRDALLAEDGPLARFAKDELQIVLRPASIYRQLLDDACLPDTQRDALDRDRLFDQLWVAVAATPRFDAIIAAEQADLRRGDIPTFLGCPGSLDLRDASGFRYADVFAESALVRMRRRLSSLCASDLTVVQR